MLVWAGAQRLVRAASTAEAVSAVDCRLAEQSPTDSCWVSERPVGISRRMVFRDRRNI